MTNIRPLRQFVNEELPGYVEHKENPDELDEEFDAAHQALVDLRDAMLKYRGIDPESDAGREVRMGNLDGLPEVTRRDE